LVLGLCLGFGIWFLVFDPGFRGSGVKFAIFIFQFSVSAAFAFTVGAIESHVFSVTPSPNTRHPTLITDFACRAF